MKTYKYFTKDSLIVAARAGNERGYNRQLDPDALKDLEWTNVLPVTFTLPHEHIAGEKVEPHIRVMVMVGAEADGSSDEKVTLDISLERYQELPEIKVPEKGELDLAQKVDGDTPEGSHRHLRLT
jgi:hypothetical protein